MYFPDVGFYFFLLGARDGMLYLDMHCHMCRRSRRNTNTVTAVTYRWSIWCWSGCSPGKSFYLYCIFQVHFKTICLHCCDKLQRCWPDHKAFFICRVTAGLWLLWRIDLIWSIHGCLHCLSGTISRWSPQTRWPFFTPMVYNHWWSLVLVLMNYLPVLIWTTGR